MTIVHPPHIYAKDINGVYVLVEYQWTDNQNLAQNRSGYIYRQAALLHEFGHSAGLGHGSSANDVMHEHTNAEPGLTSNDERAMEANYTGHSPH